MKTVIRLKRSYARMGIVFLVFHSAMVAATVVAVCIDPKARQEPIAMLVVGSGWMFFVGLSAWMILTYRRAAILLDDEEVTFTVVWLERTIRLADVTQAQWSRAPASLRLVFTAGKRLVRFGEYRIDRRRELVRYFRDGIDPALQSGWSKELENYASPEDIDRSIQTYRSTVRKIFRVLILGPIVGLAGGLVLDLVGPGAPTWSGSLVLDWSARGALVSLGLGAVFRVVQWMDAPEQLETAKATSFDPDGFR